MPELTCAGCGRSDAIKWNPFNRVIQCHHCGQVVPDAAAARLVRLGMVAPRLVVAQHRYIVEISAGKLSAAVADEYQAAVSAFDAAMDPEGETPNA